MDSQTLLTFEQFLKWQQQQPGLAGANTLNRVDFDHDKFQRRKKTLPRSVPARREEVDVDKI